MPTNFKLKFLNSAISMLKSIILIGEFQILKKQKYMIVENTNRGLVRLENNPIKQYEWGWPNNECYVGRLSGNTTFKNYAQFWMGAHWKGESEIHIKTQQNEKVLKLSQYLSLMHLEPLQYLFKVLSVNKCLSIQIHPNKTQAVALKKKEPEIYSDDNDKPESFYTLSEFQLFFGYVPRQQFERIISLDFFKEVFSGSKPTNPRQAIIQLLKLDKQKQQSLTQISVSKLTEIHPSRYENTKGKRKIWKIIDDFPNDFGIVVSFFLGYKVYQPGVCCHVEPNTPHAFISGECLEIMKNSDNVCRLGLTPKYKDLNVISEVLGTNFQQVPPVQGKQEIRNGFASTIFSGHGLNFHIIQDKKDQVHQDEDFILSSCRDIRILLVLAGQFQMKAENEEKYEVVSMGTVLLLSSDMKYRIRHGKEQGRLCLGWSDF